MRLVMPYYNQRIIPAYAGSTTERYNLATLQEDHPRIRGEHVPDAERHRPKGKDHPRIRGEHDYAKRAPAGLRGSSPHTRGAPGLTEEIRAGARIIPAYAGSTHPPRRLRRALGDHPRIRGEHWNALPSHPAAVGSSPHTRGAPPTSSPRRRRPRIIPAYAGSTACSETTPPCRADHPRIRGEHTPSPPTAGLHSGSSPHTRGARQAPASRGSGLGIIPAYAGSTSEAPSTSRAQGDHPRIRGEHCHFLPFDNCGAGSSPHTRGAHLEIPAIPRIAVVIIPVFLYPSPTPQEEADRSMVLLTLS